VTVASVNHQLPLGLVIKRQHDLAAYRRRASKARARNSERYALRKKKSAKPQIIRVQTQFNQKDIRATRQTALRKLLAHLSSRVAMRLASLRRQNMRSILLRCR
jgi:predicted solute-binding protein